MNLQLFAKSNVYYDPNSIVDYLKQNNQDSSMSARKTIAKDLGIKNYNGSSEQNILMLKTLKNGGKTTTPATTKKNTPKSSKAETVAKEVTQTPKKATAVPVKTVAKEKKNTAVPEVTNINGVDATVADTMNSTFTPSATVTQAQASKNDALNTLNSVSAPSVSKETMQAMNTPFSASSAYTEAMNYTNALLEKLSSGRTSYTDQIKDMMSQIQNRDKFSYDVDNDTLFQQALASAMGSGKQAMQDTIGQASALTGGYGSTYATSAGNQAYNAYIEDAYNNLPEYYQMAMEAYQMEGQDMYNQLAMLNDADASEYQRMYDSWNANFSNAQQMYAQEYGAWQDSVNNAYNSANLQLKQQGMAYDQAYNNYQALSSNAEMLYNQEYNKWNDMVANATNIAGMQNSDYWNGVDNTYRYDALAQDDKWNTIDNEYKYDAMENENTQAQLDREHDSSESALDRQHDSNESALDRQHDSSESSLDRAHDDAQFTARYDVNGDGKVDAKDQEVDDTADNSYKEPTETQKQKALKAYNEGGEDAYFQYLDSLPSDIDVDAIDAYVNGDGEGSKGYGELPVEKRTFTKTKDTVNGLWGVDNNDIVQDQYGNTYRIDDLPEGIRKALTKLKKGESYTAK